LITEVMSAITSLSQHGIKELCEAQNPGTELRDKYFVLQVIEVKIFTQMDNKKNIKSRITLSDGISSVVSMITDKIDKLMNGREITQYSILRINGGSIQCNPVNGRLVLVLRQPPEIVYTGMHEIIGNPTDYSNNK